MTLPTALNVESKLPCVEVSEIRSDDLLRLHPVKQADRLYCIVQDTAELLLIGEEPSPVFFSS